MNRRAAARGLILLGRGRSPYGVEDLSGTVREWCANKGDDPEVLSADGSGASQALIGLVPIRIVLLLPYIMTKNIWVSTGVHVFNDWAIFGLPLLVGGGVGGD